MKIDDPFVNLVNCPFLESNIPPTISVMKPCPFSFDRSCGLSTGIAPEALIIGPTIALRTDLAAAIKEISLGTTSTSN